jgi:hypothetical protein
VAAVDGFVEALAVSPLGVTLLAALESRTRRTEGFALSLETSPASVASTAEMVETMSFGAFANLAVLTGAIYVGPWTGDAPTTAAAAYHHAAARLPIAEGVAERFGDELHAPLDHAAQQLDGEVGTEAGDEVRHGRDAAFWTNHRDESSTQPRRPPLVKPDDSCRSWESRLRQLCRTPCATG